MFREIIMAVFLIVFSIQETPAGSSSGRGIELQLPDSGGPEIQDELASSGYLFSNR